MSINWLTILATIINFIILLFIMKVLLWNKIKLVIERRQNFILDKIMKADMDMDEARKLKEKYETILKSAGEEGKEIVRTKTMEAEEVYEEIIVKAKKDSEFLLNMAEEEVLGKRDVLMQELKDKTVDLAIVLSEKVVEKSLDVKSHKEIINKYIDVIGV